MNKPYALSIPGWVLLAAFALGCLSFLSCAAAKARSAPKPVASAAALSSLDLPFASKEVRKGRIAESGELRLSVMLPPSYAASPARRYPVVYCFHGYSDSANQLLVAGREALGEAWAEGSCPEFIMVGVDGTNSLGGSFYADSPATGNWESMVVKEVLPFVDKKFRTIKKPDARGLAGFSMGGFAAWKIGLAHAELFCAAWASCPGALSPGGLDELYPSLSQYIRSAYGAAFAPDLSLASPYARVPAFANGKVAEGEVAKLWYSGFGDIEGKLKAYLAKPQRLKALHIDCSEADYYSWITAGSKYIVKAMKEAGIDASVDSSWQTGHDISPKHMQDSFIPFYAKAFAGF